MVWFDATQVLTPSWLYSKLPVPSGWWGRPWSRREGIEVADVSRLCNCGVGQGGSTALVSVMLPSSIAKLLLLLPCRQLVWCACHAGGACGPVHERRPCPLEGYAASGCWRMHAVLFAHACCVLAHSCGCAEQWHPCRRCCVNTAICTTTTEHVPVSHPMSSLVPGGSSSHAAPCRLHTACCTFRAV